MSSAQLNPPQGMPDLRIPSDEKLIQRAGEAK